MTNYWDIWEKQGRSWEENYAHEKIRFESKYLHREIYFDVFHPGNGEIEFAIYLIGGAISRITYDQREKTVPDTYGNMLDHIAGRYGYGNYVLVVNPGYFPEGNSDIRKFLIEEEVAFIEDRYPMEWEKRKRALVGISNGGFLALDTAFISDMFFFASSHSAPPKLASLADDYRWRQYRNLKDLHILIDCQVPHFRDRGKAWATLDENEHILDNRSVDNSYRVFCGKLLNEGVPFSLEFYDGEHNWSGYGQKVEKAVIKANEVFRSERKKLGPRK